MVIICVTAVANIASAITVRGIDIEFVTIGNAGNAGDTRTSANPSSCGAVGYEYQIEKYEITNAQWNAFTAVAGEDIVADANEDVVLDASSSTDPDGDIVQYTWTALPEDEVLYSGTDSTFTIKALGRVEEVIKLTVTDNGGASSEDTVSIFNRRVEEIELTPGPQGEQGPQGPQGEQGLQGKQRPAGMIPAQIATM